jgi:hypothetical protein
MVIKKLPRRCGAVRLLIWIKNGANLFLFWTFHHRYPHPKTVDYYHLNVAQIVLAGPVPNVVQPVFVAERDVALPFSPTA